MAKFTQYIQPNCECEEVDLLFILLLDSQVEGRVLQWVQLILPSLSVIGGNSPFHILSVYVFPLSYIRERLSTRLTYSSCVKRFGANTVIELDNPNLIVEI